MTKQERMAAEAEKLGRMKAFDLDIWGGAYAYTGGVDEVGRGPLAGPVVAACVVLPEDFDVPGIDDSKKLSAKRRDELAAVIRERALACRTGRVENDVIDEINILEATKLAMKTAIELADQELRQRTGSGIQRLLIDALTIRDVGIPQKGVIKGDAASLSIAAASIVAKVYRDNVMKEYASAYPDYAFGSNMGYGTAAHYDGIRRAGICPIHRKSFLKNLDV